MNNACRKRLTGKCVKFNRKKSTFVSDESKTAEGLVFFLKL